MVSISHPHNKQPSLHHITLTGVEVVLFIGVEETSYRPKSPYIKPRSMQDIVLKSTARRIK